MSRLFVFWASGVKTLNDDRSVSGFDDCFNTSWFILFIHIIFYQLLQLETPLNYLVYIKTWKHFIRSDGIFLSLGKKIPCSVMSPPHTHIYTHPHPIINSRERVEWTGCVLSEMHHLEASRLPSAVWGPVCRWGKSHNSICTYTETQSRGFQSIHEDQEGATTHTP